MLRRSTILLALFLLMGGLVASGTLGRAAIAQGTPDTSPNGDECTWAPTTVEALQALYGTPAPEGEGEAVSATQQASPVSVTLPSGTAADDATAAAFDETIRLFFACNNGGNYLAALSHVSENMIKVAIGNSVYDQDLIAALEASPVAVAEEMQTEILGIRNHIVLDDGRVGALVDYINHADTSEGINGQETDFMILVKVGDEWHLDEVIENLEHQYGPGMEATPAS